MGRNKKLSPATRVMRLGYKPKLSEGAVVPPVFLTSTFELASAEAGERLFAELASGVDNPHQELTYSRINTPEEQICEERLAMLERAQAGAVFGSGMAAITTTLLALLEPGDCVLHSEPLYGGTNSAIKNFLEKRGNFHACLENFLDGVRVSEKLERSSGSQGAKRVGAIYLETPSNPTMHHWSIRQAERIAHECGECFGHRPPVIVDNTFMTPLGQKPLKCGADLVLHSATKYIGGHSDLLGGVVCGSKELIRRIKQARTVLGSVQQPFTSWLILRSLNTLHVRRERQVQNALRVAEFLKDAQGVARVHFPAFLTEGSLQRVIFESQCYDAGAMISFEVEGGKQQAFTLLNSLRIITHAVSLGGVESLACHPATTTHFGVSPEDKARYGICDSLVRLSVGIEDAADIIDDLAQALKHSR